MAPAFRVAEGDPTQAFGIGILGFWRNQQDGLIAPQPSGLVHLAGCDPGMAQVVLGSNDECDVALMQRIQSGEVQVTPVDDDNGAGWQRYRIEEVDVVDFACGDG